MKIILRTTIAILTIVLFAYGVASLPSTLVGDIRIEMQNGVMYCDSLICPPGAIACHVTKRNDPKNYGLIIRKRKCFAYNGAITAEETLTEPNTYEGNVNITIVSGGGDPEIVHRQDVRRKLEKSLNNQ